MNRILRARRYSNRLAICRAPRTLLQRNSDSVGCTAKTFIRRRERGLSRARKTPSTIPSLSQEPTVLFDFSAAAIYRSGHFANFAHECQHRRLKSAVREITFVGRAGGFDTRCFSFATFNRIDWRSGQRRREFSRFATCLPPVPLIARLIRGRTRNRSIDSSRCCFLA